MPDKYSETQYDHFRTRDCLDIARSIKCAGGDGTEADPYIVVVQMQGASTGDVKYAEIDVDADHELIVAAVSGKKIRVLGYTILAAAAVTVNFESFDGDSTYTDLTGPMPIGETGGASPAIHQLGQFETLTGESLRMGLSGSIAVGGHLTYQEV